MSTIPEDFSVKSRRNNELPTNLVATAPGRKTDPNLCGPETYELPSNHSPEEATDLRFSAFSHAENKRAHTPQKYRTADPFLGNSHKPDAFAGGSNNNNHHNSNGASGKKSPVVQRDFGLRQDKYTANGIDGQGLGQHPFINQSVIGGDAPRAGSANKAASPSFSSFLNEQESHIGIPLSNGMSSASAASDTENHASSLYGDQVYIKEENRNPLSPESLDMGASNQPAGTPASRPTSITTMSTYQSPSSLSPTSLDYTNSSSAFRPAQTSSSYNYYPNQIGGSLYAGSPTAYKRMNSASSRGEPMPSPDGTSRSDSRGGATIPPSLPITDALAAAASGIASPTFIASQIPSPYYHGAPRSNTERNTPSAAMVPYHPPYQGDAGSNSSAKSASNTNSLQGYGQGGYADGPPPLVQTPDGSHHPPPRGNSNEVEPLKRVIVPAGQ